MIGTEFVINTTMEKLAQNKILILLSLTGIVICGLVSRLIFLGSNPLGFFCDEASIGYNAYSMLTTGRDEYGVFLPLFYRAFGEFKNPVELYSTIPSIAIFGLTQFATRLPSAIYGTLAILAIYFLSIELFSTHRYKKIIALFSALFLAISPWGIHMSRVSLEGLSAFVFFTTLGLALFIRSRRVELALPFGLISFALALYSYFPARLFIPLFLSIILLIYSKSLLKQWKFSLASGVLFFLICLPLLFHLLGEGGTRWDQVSIFAHPADNQSPYTHVVKNYLSHFSLEFLFTKGDIDMPGQFITRHSVRGMGELYLFQLPLLILGMIWLIRHRSKLGMVLCAWLLLYPLGSMFTTDQSVQATRSIIGVIPFQIISALGIIPILVWLKKQKQYARFLFIFLSGAAVTFSFFFFLFLYFIQYPTYSQDFWGWQYGAKDIVRYFVQNQNSYDEMYMEGAFNAPDIFFKFYAPHDCQKCRLGVPDQYINSYTKQLYAVTPHYFSEHPEIKLHIKKTIYYPNQTVAFVIGEIVQ